MAGSRTRAFRIPGKSAGKRASTRGTTHADRNSRAAGAAFAAVLAWGTASGAAAQQLPGVEDYRLPPAGTSTPAAPGPVDSGPPPAPSPTPAPAPSPPAPARPVITVPTPVPAPSGGAAQTARPAPARPATTAAPSTAAEPAGTPPPAEAAAGLPPAPSAAVPAPATSDAGPLPEVSPTAPSPDLAGNILPGWAIPAGLAVLAAIGLVTLLRRGRAAGEAKAAADFVRPVVPAPAAGQDAEEEFPNEAEVAPAGPLPPLSIALEATRLNASLVNATLSYRLRIANNGDVPLRDLVVSGDMTSAHASRPVEEQLGTDGAALPWLHGLAALPPGEEAVLTGDIRLPLAAITPIRRGAAALFVPLARIEAFGALPDGEQLAVRGTFLVGQEPEDGAARLQPFRLDLGPRVYARVGQRLLEMPAGA